MPIAVVVSSTGMPPSHLVGFPLVPQATERVDWLNRWRYQ